jgi:hypothetical protein
MSSQLDCQISDNQILASAVRFLIDGGEEDAASVLLSCSLHSWWWSNDFGCDYYNFLLKGPRAAYDVLNDLGHPIRISVKNAIQAILPVDITMHDLMASGELIDLDPDWRSELLEIARGRGVSNQAAGERAAKILNWNNLGFRSASEIKIAQALDRAGVLFLPNCKARLGSGANRQNREPDFLICHNGKWGILEVDGEFYHQPSRTVADHERDRLFKIHGITVAEHYDANKCFNNPDEVVNEFLIILDQQASH